MFEAYKKIFKRCGLDAVIIEADSGAMGGDVSHEFMIPAPIGEDTILMCDDCDLKVAPSDELAEGNECPQCKKGKLSAQVAIELGHIFQLGTKYSKDQQALFLDEDGKQKPLIMGCYGIGVSRIISAIIEVSNDDKGIIWPREVAPFDVEILPLSPKEDDSQIKDLANKYYKSLSDQGFDVLVDDRQESPGRKFNDADLIGVPFRITIGQRNLKNNKVEIKVRKSQEEILVNEGEVVDKVQEMLSSNG